MTFKFDTFDVSQQVFYSTDKTFAFVNLRPIRPGHVLVSPKRVIKRLNEMTHDEVVDFFLTVQFIEKVVEKIYNSSSSNIAIQDGLLAGQSVEHVHCHIIPRHESDFPDIDDVYKYLDKCDYVDAYRKMSELITKRKGGVDFDDRSNRTMDEMVAEAEMIRNFIDNNQF